MKVLERTEFGNPILRKKARRLLVPEIKSAKVQSIIKDMRHTLMTKKMGVGLAAPQIGRPIALAVIAIRPTAHRPNVEPYDMVLINPEIVQKISNTKPMWEGCLSAGKESLFAKVPRYSKITVKYQDASGKFNEKQFSGLRAQVIQHEVDHLNGILFVDRVKDPKTYMSLSEYKKRVASKKRNSKVL